MIPAYDPNTAAPTTAQIGAALDALHDRPEVREVLLHALAESGADLDDRLRRKLGPLAPAEDARAGMLATVGTLRNFLEVVAAAMGEAPEALRCAPGRVRERLDVLREALVAITEESPDGGAVACAREALGLEAMDDEEMTALVKARGGRAASSDYADGHVAGSRDRFVRCRQDMGRALRLPDDTGWASLLAVTAALREALAPFAARAATYPNDVIGGGTQILGGDHGTIAPITVEHFRAAARALGGKS